jgi:DNA-binding beta-propeller fold protein YncE
VVVCSTVITSLLVAGFVHPAGAAGAHVVKVTRTRSWRVSAPDPRGLTYNARTHRLLISDSEIDETSRWAGKNLFTVSRSGRLRRAGTVAKATVEPEDVAWNNRRQQLYVVDDDTDRIFRFSRGHDRVIGTKDDPVRTVLKTRRFGSSDPEGLGLCVPKGMLLVTDSTKGRVYKIRRGRDRKFGTSDDLVGRMSTRRFGFRFPTDVTWDPRSGHLFVVSPVESSILEMTLHGKLVRRIGLAGTTIRAADGIVFAPGSNGRPHHLYVVDAGIDDSVKPKQNDGRLFELALPH